MALTLTGLQTSISVIAHHLSNAMYYSSLDEHSTLNALQTHIKAVQVQVTHNAKQTL